jgi:probable HAF family extracellular repeat protein
MVDLGTLGGTLSYATHINDVAQVVGWSMNPSDESHAFLWKDLNADGQSNPGEMIDLGALPGGNMSLAYCINDIGQVVGRSNFGESPGYEVHAFLWQDLNANGQSDTGEMTDLGTLGGDYSEAVGVNNLGQVVGISETPTGDQHAFLLTPNGDTWYRDADSDGVNDLMLDLGVGTLGLPDSAAMGINDVPQVVGWIRSLDPVDIRPFMWTPESGMREIGAFGGPISLAVDVNNLGQVVGRSDLQASGEIPTHAFLWTENGGMTDLGTLGGSSSSASEIDETGKRIVGSSETSTGERRAPLWRIFPDTSVGRLSQVTPHPNVQLTYSKIREPGLTTVTESPSGPGFRLDGHEALGAFYQISTTAVFTDVVYVCLLYPEPNPPIEENDLSLWHCKDETCSEITPVDRYPEEDRICGTVSSFSWVVAAVPAAKTVSIDIKPGSYPNSINLGSNGNVPVAILSTEDFDATSVDPLSISLAGASVRLKGKGTPMSSMDDIDGDGLMDIVVHVDTTALELGTGDLEAVLEGRTLSGVRITGTDTVRILE